MVKLISILGSTGSIGRTSLRIIKKKKILKPYIFSSNKNYSLICEQIKEFKPNYFIVFDKKIYEKVLKKFKRHSTKILNSLDLKYFKKKSDITILAIPGIDGLQPTIEMIKKSKKMLLANKESIICGWNLIYKNSKKYQTKIIPIDSEHFSILKLLENISLKEIEKVYLTASGGPFLGFKYHQLKKIKPQQALKHPKWKMGKKISVDSSTLMNKILELIEAQKLFNIPNNKLQILIHPQSLVHAIVTFKNGISKFIYHDTSMLIPIGNAIFEDNFNINNFLVDKITKKKIENLSFLLPDKDNFPILKLIDKLNKFSSSSIIINASNEVLVDHFLRNKVPFLAIPFIIEAILRDRNYLKYAIRKPKNLIQINKINNWAKQTTKIKINKYYEKNL